MYYIYTCYKADTYRLGMEKMKTDAKTLFSLSWTDTQKIVFIMLELRDDRKPVIKYNNAKKSHCILILVFIICFPVLKVKERIFPFVHFMHGEFAAACSKVERRPQ